MKHILTLITAAITVVSCKNSPEPNYIRPVTPNSSKWISQIVEYRPAPGQFINKSPGDLASAQGIVGKKGMVSLGGFGGYIIFSFDHTVINQDGMDFVIHGNAFEGSSEAGAVMVAEDTNGNGKADDNEWFELRGSEYDGSHKNLEITYSRPPQTLTAMDVAWTANDLTSGALHSQLIAQFHNQCYYPLFLQDDPSQLVLTGNRVANTATEKDGIWTMAALAKGYADNYSADYMAIQGSDRDTERSNKFDIEWAVDSQGRTVKLQGIDYIKVYTCVHQEAGWLGEVSTEVCGAISLSVR